MRKLALLFAFAIAGISVASAQSTSCNADCLFTSCSITCTSGTPGGGGAICTCAWGFASCACGQGSGGAVSVDAEAVTRSTELRATLESFKTASASSAAAMIPDILAKATNKDFAGYQSAVAQYNKLINGLNESQKSQLTSKINSLKTATRN